MKLARLSGSSRDRSLDGHGSPMAADYYRVLAAHGPDFQVDRIYTLGATIAEDFNEVDRVARLFAEDGCAALRELPPIDLRKDFLQVIFAVSRDGRGWVTIIIDPFELSMNAYVARDLGERQVDTERCGAELIYAVG
jgi:hypothetical protein